MRKWQVFVFAAILFAPQAFAASHGSVSVPVIPNCPQGTTYTNDGCSNAPPANNSSIGTPGTRQQSRTTFYGTTAPQSGQTYVTANYGKQNIPGVDYPVGVNANTLAAGVTINTLATYKDPSTTGPCGYNSSAHQITCSGTSGDIEYNGYNFSLHGGIAIQTSGTYTGNLKIRNSYFKYTASGGTPGNSAFLIANPNTFTFENNIIDMGANDTTNWLYAHQATTTFFSFSGTLPGSGVNTDCGNTDPICIQYNAIYHVPARLGTSGHPNAVTEQYNWIESICQPYGIVSGFIDDGLGGGSYDATPGTVLTVTGVTAGGIVTGWAVTGVTLRLQMPGGGAGAQIASQTSGTTGGVGVYALQYGTGYGPKAVPPGTLYLNDQIHGDQWLFNFASGTQAEQNFVNNVLLNDINDYGTTSWFTPSETGAGTITNYIVTMTTEITQASTVALDTNDHRWPTSTAMIGNNNPNDTINHITITNNNMDPTGAYDCFNLNYTGSPTITVSGNTNLLDATNANMNPSNVTTPSNCSGVIP